ncbi:MAG: site-specific integrase [Methyloceanibacter sp.]|uniref:site-specific integrase n=1 Tax=Methyloceanibacter sp. TaxID=1965321 RepID=UPI003D9BA118
MSVQSINAEVRRLRSTPSPPLSPLTNPRSKCSALVATLEHATSAANDYATASKSAATRRVYRTDAADFAAWCERHAVDALPATVETVAAYLASLARSGLKASTITRRCAGIRYMHRLAGLESPTSNEAVKAVLSGIRRSIGTAVIRKEPATAEMLRVMIADTPEDLRGLRDRALLLLGFAGALRRSELVTLDVRDLEETNEGLLVHIRKSKTDQEGIGDFVSIPHGSRLRPVGGLTAWLQAAGITEGPIFRSIKKGGSVTLERLSDRSVAQILKRRAESAGFDSTLFSGHSLRAGFVTSALHHGADILRVMDVTRHREVSTLKTYDRRAKAFKQHAGEAFL